MVGQRNEPTGGGLWKTFDIKCDLCYDAGLDLGDAGDLGDAVGEGIGSALELGEDLGETMASVIGFTRVLQGIERTERHNERRHAAGHDRRNRERLALHLPEVSEQLAV